MQQNYIAQHDNSNPFIARRRAQVLQEARTRSVAYLARIDTEVRATIATETLQARQTRKHLKLVK